MATKKTSTKKTATKSRKATRKPSARATKKDATKTTRTRKTSKKVETPVVVAEENKKSYPFASKKDIVNSITTDAAAAVAALVQVHDLDAAMCSQKKAVAALAAEVKESDDAAGDKDLVARCRTFALRYSRRLAKESRRGQIESNPELAELATLFSAGV